MGKNSDCNIFRPMIKIWCRQVPMFGSFLLASVLANSGTAMAAGTPGAQPTPTATPGIATPDEAVRKMALEAIVNSQKIAAKRIISSSNTNNFSAKTPATSGLKSAMLAPSQVLNNCRGGNCEFNLAQPPVTLGTAAPISTISPLNIPTPVAATPASPAKNSESVAIKSLNSKDRSSGPSSVPDNLSEAMVNEPKITDKANNKSSLLGGVNQQLAYLKEMAISSSKQFLTVMPQIDTSLFAMGNSFASAKAISFNPRLTLGNLDTTVKPTTYFNTTKYQSFSSASASMVLKQPKQDKMLLLSNNNLISSNTSKLLLLSNSKI
jgi:hypothetical protein